MRNNERRPDMEALWKSFATHEPAESRPGPAISVGAIHGPVLSIVTNQPLQVGELWAQACSARHEKPR